MTNLFILHEFVELALALASASACVPSSSCGSFTTTTKASASVVIIIVIGRCLIVVIIIGGVAGGSSLATAATPWPIRVRVRTPLMVMSDVGGGYSGLVAYMCGGGG